MKKFLAYLGTAAFALSLVAPVAVSAQTASVPSSSPSMSAQKPAVHHVRKVKRVVHRMKTAKTKAKNGVHRMMRPHRSKKAAASSATN